MTGTWGTGGVRCKIAPQWEGAGREGHAICYFDSYVDQLWVVVKWNDDDDPDLHKAAGLLLKHIGDKRWKTFD